MRLLVIEKNTKKHSSMIPSKSPFFQVNNILTGLKSSSRMIPGHAQEDHQLSSNKPPLYSRQKVPCHWPHRTLQHHRGTQLQRLESSLRPAFHTMPSVPPALLCQWCLLLHVIFHGCRQLRHHTSFYVRGTFHWGSLPAGLMFVALNVPMVPLAPLCGALKDCVGTWLPTVVGFLSIAVWVWLLGFPGRFPGIDGGPSGQALYIISMIMIGFSIPFLNSVGTLEVTCKLLFPRPERLEYPHAHSHRSGN